MTQRETSSVSKVPKSLFKPLVCRDRTKQTGIVMRLLTSTSRAPLDKVATSNKSLHGRCNTRLGYNVPDKKSLLSESAQTTKWCLAAKCRFLTVNCRLR